MNFFNNQIQADGVAQKLVVFFGIGKDRQYADLVHQAAQGCLVRLEASVVLA